MMDLHIGWWFLGQTLIIIACFISVDRYNFRRGMVLQTLLYDVLQKLETIEDLTDRDWETCNDD